MPATRTPKTRDARFAHREPGHSTLRMPTGVLFDLDGTLVDSTYQHALAWHLAFREHAVFVPVWRIHRHVGMGGDKLVGAVAGELIDSTLGDDLRAAHRRAYGALIDTTQPFAGARDLVAGLRSEGRKIVLATSSEAAELDHQLDALGIRDLVDGWTTADDVASTKPEPDVVRAALDVLGEPEAVMVGDSPWDVAAAARAGIPTVAVRSGGFAESELVEAGAVAVFDSVAVLTAEDLRFASASVLAG